MAGKQVCPQDCPRRRVGCRSGCPKWAAHEKSKAERYAVKKMEYDSWPTSEVKERLYRRKLRRGQGK